MYNHVQPGTLEELEKSLQEAKGSVLPFILDFTNIKTISSRIIRKLVEIHSNNTKGFYLLLPNNPQLIEIFERESLLGIIRIFHNIKDIKKIVLYKETPCYSDYFIGKLFDISIDYKDELERAASNNGQVGLAWNLRNEFLEQDFSLPNRLTIKEENEEWYICEYQNDSTIDKVWYIVRKDIYGEKLEVCQRLSTFYMSGTLQGKELADHFFSTLKNKISPIIFIDMNNCYAWDQNFMDAFRKAKEYKKLYLVRADTNNAESLFKLEGDLVYCDYEQAYEKAKLILCKEWEIDSYLEVDNEEDDDYYIIKLNGYVKNDEEEVNKFYNELFKILKDSVRDSQRICLDIRELYRLESEARKMFIKALQKCVSKKRSNIIVIANLPRPDYIIYDVVEDLYFNKFFIVSNLEDAKEMHSSYTHPHFLIENSMNISILTMEGNIFHDKERKIFKGEINNMLEHSLSLFLKSSNMMKSPQKAIFFDFGTIPTVYRPILDTIMKLAKVNENLISVLLVNEHLQELIKKSLSEYTNIFYYTDKKEAFEKHLCNILIVTSKNELEKSKDYFREIFKDLYASKDFKNKQFRTRFHCNTKRLASLLDKEDYNLIILHSTAKEDEFGKVSGLLRKYEKPVLEFKSRKDGWLHLYSNQLEQECSKKLAKEKIIDMLIPGRMHKVKENSFLFKGNHWSYVEKEVFEECLEEKELELVQHFLPVVDEGDYETILTYEANQIFITLEDASTQKALKKLEYHPYKQWERNFTFYFQSSCVELAQKSTSEYDISNSLQYVQEYGNHTKGIWEIIPNKIKKSTQHRWINFIAAKNRLVGISFRNTLFELQFISLSIHREIQEIFNEHLWIMIKFLKKQLENDLRYRGLELPLVSTLQTILNFLNAQNSNTVWFNIDIEVVYSDQNLEILLNIDNICEITKLPDEIIKVIEKNKLDFKIMTETMIEPEKIKVKFALKNLNRRVITIKKN